MSTQESIISSLEIVAEKSGDITSAVYDLYYQNSPGSRELMVHIDHLVQGRMMDEVLRLLMVEDASSEDQYLAFEMKTHKEAYNVVESMYGSLLAAVWQIVREGVGEDWNENYEDAWQERVTSLLDELKRHSAVGTKQSMGQSGNQ